MQLQTTSPESKFPNEYIGTIFIQIDQHLKKLFKKYKGFPIFWNTVYISNFVNSYKKCSFTAEFVIFGVLQFPKVRYVY